MLNTLGVLFQFPTATDFLAGVGAWSLPLLNEFWELIYILLGFGIIFFILKFFVFK